MSEFDFGGVRKILLSASIVIGLTFGGLGTWAATAPLSSAVISPGFFKVSSNRKSVQHLEGGIVAEIKISDGDHVRTGDVLIRLDATDAASEAGILSARRHHLIANIMRARAELLRRSDLHPAHTPSTARPLNSEQYHDQQNLLTARLQSLESSEKMVAAQVARLGQEIGAATSQLTEVAVQLSSIQVEIDTIAPLVEKQLVAKTRLLGLQRQAAVLRAQHAEMTARRQVARQSISESEAQLTRLRAEFFERANSELNDYQRLYAEVEKQLISAEHRLRLSEIRATADGTVVGMTAFTEGGIIGRGQKLMEIVPDNEPLEIESRIEVNKIDLITPGQNVMISLISASTRDLAKISGRVTYKSADSFLDEATGSSYFIVRAAVDKATLPAEAAAIIQPGLGAELYFQTGDRTALEFLIDPLRKSLARAWREV